jgi:hypothetical protein
MRRRMGTVNRVVAFFQHPKNLSVETIRSRLFGVRSARPRRDTTRIMASEYHAGLGRQVSLTHLHTPPRRISGVLAASGRERVSSHVR